MPADRYAKYFRDPFVRGEFDRLRLRIYADADPYVAEDRYPVERAFDEPLLARLKVLDFLLLFGGIGVVRAQRIMECVRVAESRSVAALTERQRAELIRQLELNRLYEPGDDETDERPLGET